MRIVASEQECSLTQATQPPTPSVRLAMSLAANEQVRLAQCTSVVAMMVDASRAVWPIVRSLSECFDSCRRNTPFVCGSTKMMGCLAQKLQKCSLLAHQP